MDGDTPLGQGIDGASGGMPTACVTNDFTLLTIFLIVEGEGGIHCPVQVCLGGGGGVQFVVPDGEGDVAHVVEFWGLTAFNSLLQCVNRLVWEVCSVN